MIILAGLVVVALTGWAAHHGWLFFGLDFNAYASSPSSWVLAGLAFVSFSVVLAATIEYLLAALNETITRLDNRIEALEDVNQTLKRNIADRKRAREEPRRSQEFNRRFIDSSRDCIQVLDVKGRIRFINPIGLGMLGLKDETEYIDQPYEVLWEPSSGAEARRAVEQALQDDHGAFAGLCRAKQGEFKWWDVVVTPMQDPLGQVESLIAVSRDITDRMAAEASIKESEEKYRGLFETMARASCTRTAKGGSFPATVRPKASWACPSDKWPARPRPRPG